MKLVYVGLVFPHHKGTHAGYNHIKDFLPYDYDVDCQMLYSKFACSKSFFGNLMRRIGYKFFGYRIIPFFLLKVFFLSLTNKNLIFHVIYGEDILTKWFLACTLKHKVVCTLHQPFAWSENNPSFRECVKRTDKVILMASNELEKFKCLKCDDNVTYIPHGICSDFYHLPSDKKEEKNGSVLMVGDWLRDFDIANKVFIRLLQNNPDQIINVVCSKENRKYFTDSRINCFTGITDEELRTLYWKSAFLFLPVKRFTANNALLESSACGCNIMIASEQIENSYIPEQYTKMMPLDFNVCCQNLSEFLNEKKPSDFSFFDTISEYVISNYSWRKISEKTISYLRQK